MRRFVPRRCRGVDDNAPRKGWWGEHDRWETRCLILQDEATIGILGGIGKLREWRKQQKVLDVLVPCELPEGGNEDLGK